MVAAHLRTWKTSEADPSLRWSIKPCLHVQQVSESCRMCDRSLSETADQNIQHSLIRGFDEALSEVAIRYKGQPTDRRRRSDMLLYEY